MISQIYSITPPTILYIKTIYTVHTKPAMFLWICKEVPSTLISGELYYYKLL